MATPKKGSKSAKAKMAKVRAAIKRKKSPAKKSKSVIVTERQTPVKWTNAGDGYLYQYNKEKDRAKKGAKRPGKRISKDGNVYYEYRVNRSDKSGSLTGTNFKSFITYKGYIIDKVALSNGKHEYWVNSLDGKYHFFQAVTLSQAKKFIDRTLKLLKTIQKTK
jgi:hypothetical protein